MLRKLTNRAFAALVLVAQTSGFTAGAVAHAYAEGASPDCAIESTHSGNCVPSHDDALCAFGIHPGAHLSHRPGPKNVADHVPHSRRGVDLPAPVRLHSCRANGERAPPGS